MASSPNGSLTESHSKPLVWVTGANGLIGNYVVRLAPKLAPNWRVRAVTRAQLDLLDFNAVRRKFEEDRPRLVIHCAAITGVAEAQAAPALARRVNVEATQRLAESAAEIQFVFFSSDLVFDGQKGNYTEADPVNPIHVYGETKAVAEQIVLKNPRHLVVRTSINGGISPAGNRGFNEQLRLAWKSGRPTTLFKDEFRSPIFAGETARAVWELVTKRCAGLFHVAGAERLSRWQIGRLLARRWPELKADIKPGSSRDFPGPLRAPDTSLNISRIQNDLSRPLAGLVGWLTANPREPF
ncbi:MAG TPA: SDR family oxidoreductase [Candidatus Acidoferrales bacterium]|nr:SDR family oxidoreductase [Candidatus Acidoferrales bacterium]